MKNYAIFAKSLFITSETQDFSKLVLFTAIRAA